MTPERLRDIANAGWTYKERYIDKNPALGLLGIRLTNAAKIWDEGYSIQIFNRTTVTLAQKANATIDDHVSLTKDDGRDFLEWLRLTHPEILPPEIWEKLPEGEAESAGPASSDEARSALLQYLVPRYPEYFGAGSMAASGAPFEATILAVIRHGENIPAQVAESGRLTMRTILYLETMAHDCYKETNSHLHNAHGADDVPRKLAYARMAYLAMGAAIEARERAATMRRDYGTSGGDPAPLPEASFPEAIDPNEVWAVIEAAFGQAAAHTIASTTARVIAQESAGVGIPAPLTEADVTPGMLVTIADPNHPRFRQVAEIYCRVGKERYALSFKGESGAPQFNLSQLRRIA